MKMLRHLLIAIVIVAIGLFGWLFFGHRVTAPVTDTVSTVEAARLHDPALIAKGEYLATIGDCATCHTAQGGQRYAGGRMMPTPFGDVPTSNLTADPATGLGHWSFEAFWRAMHLGQARDGRLLYPAFPYTSYTKVGRDDALAIFAYLKSLAPVHQPNTQPGLDFPYNLRASLVAWRSLYFNPGEFKADPAKSAQWNRGAYLVEGLGHCNECHVARDSLGGLPKNPQLSGGQIPVQNWYAPDLSTQANGGLDGWSGQDIVDLLKTGQSAKGAAFGPMAEVVARSTQHMTDADLRAIAVYLQSLPARPAPVLPQSPLDDTAVVQQGGHIYEHRCAACHGKDGNGAAGVYPPLNGNSSVVEPSGINAIRVVLLGGFPPVTAGNPRPYSMPPFAQQLKDAEVAAVVTYIRQAWSNKATPVQERDVASYRHTPIE